MTFRTSLSGIWRAGAVALVSISLVSVTACSGGGTPPPGSPSPAESQSPSASSTTSAVPTPTASYKPADASGRAQNVPVPELPEAAKAETKAGAIAFAAYWFKLLSYGYETGKLTQWEAVTSPGCDPCSKAKSVIGAWHSGGRWLVGGTITTPTVSSQFVRDADATYQVVVQTHQAPLTYMRQDATVARSDSQPDDKGNLLFLSYGNGRWTLVNIGSIVG